MKQFNDNSGRTWTITINVGTIEKVKDLLDVDMLSVISDGEMLLKLQRDYALVCNIIYAIASPCDITKEDFQASMYGDVLETAASALSEELANFFPRLDREAIKAAIAEIKSMKEKLYSKAIEDMKISNYTGEQSIEQQVLSV